MKCKLIWGALVMALAPTAHSQCYGFGMSYDNVVVWPQPDLRVRVPTDKDFKKAPPLLVKAKPAVKENARKLALHFPPAQRAEVEQYYLESMATYLKIEKKMGWAPRDMAGGLAAFLVGNYMVLNNRNVSDEEYAAVASQLRAQQSMQKVTQSSDQEKLRTCSNRVRWSAPSWLWHTWHTSRSRSHRSSTTTCATPLKRTSSWS